MRTTPRRSVPALVLAVVAALMNVGAAADAAPVFALASMGTGGYVSTSGDDCTTEESESPDAAGLAVAENGPPVSAQRSSTSTTTYTPDPSDVIRSSTAVTGTAGISSAGGDLHGIDFDAQVSSSVATSGATSACWVATLNYAVMEYEVLVTRGGFLTVRTSNRGDISTDLSIGTESDKDKGRVGSYVDRHFAVDGDGLKVDDVATVYLPPGEYAGYLEASLNLGGNATKSLSGAGSVHATFAVAGSRTEGASGKGSRYVTLPEARSCGSHALTPSVTDKRKRAKRIKQVTFLVDDTVVKRVRTPRTGEMVAVPVGDEQGGELRAVVKLFPTHKGKPGKVVEVSAAYAPCS